MLQVWAGGQPWAALAWHPRLPMTTETITGGSFCPGLFWTTHIPFFPGRQ